MRTMLLAAAAVCGLGLGAGAASAREKPLPNGIPGRVAPRGPVDDRALECDRNWDWRTFSACDHTRAAQPGEYAS